MVVALAVVVVAVVGVALVVQIMALIITLVVAIVIAGLCLEARHCYGDGAELGALSAMLAAKELWSDSSLLPQVSLAPGEWLGMAFQRL